MATWGSKKNYGLPDSVLDAVREVVNGEELEEKKLDPVNPKALKKDFDDREDQDLDNDGDVDDSDEYLHKRRQTVSKAMKSEKKNAKGMTKNPDPVEVDPKLKEEAKVKCPRCGTMNDPSNDKCTNCGLPLSEFDSFQKEEVELTEREDTAMQVARALKKMGVKPNAKEADVIKKIPKVLDSMNLTPGTKRMILRDPDFIGDVFDSMNEEVELDEAMKTLAKKGDYEVATKGDGVAQVMYKGKEVGSGDLDDLAGGWFISMPGKKGQQFFDSPAKIVDFFMKNKVTG